LVDAVVDVLEGEVTEEDVVAIASQDLTQLPEQVVDAVVQVLNTASDEVKVTLEQEVNVFDGALDEYIPSGSNVTVAERRTIVAVTATVASPVSPLPTRRRKA